MISPLSFVVFAFTVTVAAGQENEEPSQQSANVPQLSQQPMQPQIYFKDSPGKQYEIGHHGPTSTTVCVELRNGPANPYTVCGPQVSSGIVQPQLIYPGYQKDSIKVPIQIQPTQQQPLPSEPQPVIISQNRRLIQSQPSPIPVLVQPMAAPLPQLYRSPAAYQSPNLLYQKQFNSASQHNTMATDGSLSMNCRVGGLKLTNQDASSLNSMYSSGGYRLPQPVMSSSFQNSYKTPSANYDRYPLWNYDASSYYNSYSDPSMYSFDMSGRDVTGSNEMMHDQIPQLNMADSSAAIDTSKMIDENRKKLNELKQQLASLQDIKQDVHAQRASQNEQAQSTTQNQTQPTVQPQQEQLHQHSSQSSTEQKPNKNPNQQQSQGQSRQGQQRKSH